MNEKSLSIFIDFGSSKIRLGIFDKETSKNILTLEKDCISNFSINNFDIKSSAEIIKDLIKLAEKKINNYIKNINLMIDTPDMFSVDISIKKNSDGKKYSKDDINSLLNESKSLVQKNYINKKIVHMIVKKFIFDNQEFFEIPDEKINYNFLIIELKFICFSDLIWKNLQDSFSKNYLNIDNLYCSSYVRSSSYNLLFNDFNKCKIVHAVSFDISEENQTDKTINLYTYSTDVDTAAIPMTTYGYCMNLDDGSIDFASYMYTHKVTDNTFIPFYKKFIEKFPDAELIDIDTDKNNMKKNND